MLLNNGCHLTYCTNIHPGESWEDHQRQLKQHLPAIHKLVAPEEKFGVGLRLSAKAGEELAIPEKMEAFKSFLAENNQYVFTMNGFPYGKFHQTSVKDKVHQPDWQTAERVNYTKNIFTLLAELVPEGLDGGISTSPLSYKPWFTSPESFNAALTVSVRNLVEVVVHLYKIKAEKGIELHLDIEPEPDGILENSAEVVHFYNNWLLTKGNALVSKALGVSNSEAERAIRAHIQVCYDVCHFALVYEAPEAVFKTFKREGIGIGKIQLSAALSATIGKEKEEVKAELKQFEENVYLHQVITKDKRGLMNSYRDLPQAFQNSPANFEGEWRIHFHVPLFVAQYGHLASTQQDVLETLKLVKQENMRVHLEVETYTWDVLPNPLKLDIDASIARELNWVRQGL